MGDERRGHPGGVDGEVGRGQVGQPGVFEFADAFLGSAASSVQRLEGHIGIRSGAT
jgi:hypothetical protein